MKKVALVFVLAVLLPSLVLAWLAVRSLRDQQFLLERQQSLLCQRVTDTLAQNISGYLAQQQQVFGAQVEDLAAGKDAQAVAAQFDSELRSRWPLAEVGFCVTLSGRILSPSPSARAEARTFYTDNSAFFGNREAVEVYQSANAGFNNLDNNAALNFARNTANKPASINGLSGSGASQRQAQPTLTASAPPVQSRQQEIALAKQTAAPGAAAQPPSGKMGRTAFPANSAPPASRPPNPLITRRRKTAKSARKAAISNWVTAHKSPLMSSKTTCPRWFPPRRNSASSSAVARTGCSRGSSRTNSGSCSGTGSAPTPT